jgi:FkbM family methyltransferase
MTVRKWLALALRKLGHACFAVARRVYLAPQERRAIPWVRDRGDQTLRVEYEGLNPQSTVVDAGGYEGQWASDIFSRYACAIHIFEPVTAYADRIQRRFVNNEKIHVYCLALGANDGAGTMDVAQDGSSLFKQGQQAQTVRVVRAVDFFETHGLHAVDLMKVNIEGAEYDLLEHLIQTGFVRRIGNLQVQFHDFVPDAVRRMRAIQGQLEQTHTLTYQYPFVWENWRLRPATSLGLP